MQPVRTWWHAASLGEVAALEPVLEAVDHDERAGPFTVTTTSCAGRIKAEGIWPDRVSLAPLDFPRAVGRAMDARRPTSLVLVETELWPNWLTEAHRREVKVAVINGRISDRSWPRYRRLRSLFRPLVAPIQAFAIRTDLDAERFQALGARRDAIRITGNTKHDRFTRSKPARLPWGNYPVWTVGSLRPGEERTVVASFLALTPRHPDLKLVLVPRHPDLWPKLRGHLEAHGFRVALSSDPNPSDHLAQVLIVDTQGELPAYYAAATVIGVGGTWVPVGGHNVLEASLYGAPLIFGSHTANIEEEATALLVQGGAKRAETAPDLIDAIDRWLADHDARREAGARAKETLESFRGASRRTVDWLVHHGILVAGEKND
jgi:3-deoxy-D-manno-octulosonic-acid transferase